MHGTNVHFGQVGQKDYTEDRITECISDCKRMRFNALRCDFNTDSRGNTLAAPAEPFLTAAKAANMKVLTVLYLKGRGSLFTNLNDTFKTNYEAAAGFSKQHPDIQYYEIDNELDVKGTYINYANNVYGTHIDDSAFDMQQYRVLLSQVKGFIAGVKAVNPLARIGMNYGYIHYGLIKRLMQDGAQLFWSGLNAYNNEEYALDNYRKPCFGNLVNIMKYGLPSIKEYYVTEFGFYPNGKNPDKLTQDQYVAFVLPEYIGPNTNGYFVYEWINQVNTRKGDEANLGMTEITKQLFVDGKG